MKYYFKKPHYLWFDKLTSLHFSQLWVRVHSFIYWITPFVLIVSSFCCCCFDNTIINNSWMLNQQQQQHFSSFFFVLLFFLSLSFRKFIYLFRWYNLLPFATPTHSYVYFCIAIYQFVASFPFTSCICGFFFLLRLLSNFNSHIMCFYLNLNVMSVIYVNNEFPRLINIHAYLSR